MNHNCKDVFCFTKQIDQISNKEKQDELRIVIPDKIDYWGWFALACMCARNGAYESYSKDDFNVEFVETSGLFYFFTFVVNDVEVGRCIIRTVEEGKLYNVGSFNIYPNFRNKGYAKEAIKQIMKIAEVSNVELEIVSNNSSMIHILNSLEKWYAQDYMHFDREEALNIYRYKHNTN